MPVTKFNRHPLIKCLLDRYEQKCQMSVSYVFLLIFLRKMSKCDYPDLCQSNRTYAMCNIE